MTFSKFNFHKRSLGESKSTNRRRRRTLKKLKQQLEDDMSDHSEETCRNISETLSRHGSLKKSRSLENKRRYTRRNNSFPSSDYNIKYHLYDDRRQDKQSRLKSNEKTSRRQHKDNFEQVASSSTVARRTMRDLTNQGISYNNAHYNPLQESQRQTNQQNPGAYSSMQVDGTYYQHNTNSALMQDPYCQREAAQMQAPYSQQEVQQNQYYATNPCNAFENACVPPMQLAVDAGHSMIQNYNPAIPFMAYNPLSLREQVVDTQPYNEKYDKCDGINVAQNNSYYDPRYLCAQQFELNIQQNNNASTSAPLGHQYEGIHVQNENSNTIDTLMYY